MNLSKIFKELWRNEGRPAAMSILDIWRAVLHFPVGCFAAWLIYVLPAIGIVFSISFLAYEVVEDWRIKDRGYKDIFGYLVGIGVMSVVLYFLQ